MFFSREPQIDTLVMADQEIIYLLGLLKTLDTV